MGVLEKRIRSIGLSNYYIKEAFDKVMSYAIIIPSVIQNENHIVNVAMGAGSMVVGQYYMKTISEKMDTLKNGVDRISSFQDEE